MSDTNHPAGHVLQAFHDGELDPAATAETAAHCEHCPACRDELAALAHLDLRLSGAASPELSHSVWRSVQPQRANETRLKPAFAIAACAAGVVVGVLLGPVRFNTQEALTEVTQSETVTMWNSGSNASLLSVYEIGLE